VRTGRNADEARLRVLLDVLVASTHGLRRELALPASLDSPADLVAEGEWQGRRVALDGLPDDDPGLLEYLLTVPHVHLLVDGYNVRSEEHTSELQSRFDLVCRLLLEKKK